MWLKLGSKGTTSLQQRHVSMLAYWTTCSVSHECAELLEVLSYMIVYVLKFKPLYRSGTLDTCIVGYLAISFSAGRK